jgi:hypothetical protein
MRKKVLDLLISGLSFDKPTVWRAALPLLPELQEKELHLESEV